MTLLVPAVANTDTLGLSKTECQHVLHPTMSFSAQFNQSEVFRTHVNHYVDNVSVSVKTDDLFWKCRIS